jgi:hypothetical protein
MKGMVFLGLLLLAAAGLSGCAQTGMFAATHLTEVQLNQDNYRLVATDVAGSAKAGYLLGISYPAGMATNTLALARVQGTGLLYKEALADLWADFAAKYGPVADRKLALVNVRYDSDNLNLLLFTRPTLSIRADVVEFIK